MKFIIKGFVTNKNSESYSDCADNYAFSTENHRFAISDGVSVSFFSGIWSQILVDNYVKSNDVTDLNFIEACQKQWQQKIEEIVQQPNVKWFVKSKYSKKDFAAATLVGLEFFEEKRQWQAQFIGDSFLFFIPKNCVHFEGVIKYPEQNNFVFDNYPNYLASIDNNHRGEPHISAEEQITEGTFFLMTDALSEWFIGELKKDVKKVLTTLHNLKNQNDFLEIIQLQRNQNTLKNDDSAVLMIEVVDNQSEKFSYEVAYFSNLQKLAKKGEKEKQTARRKNNVKTVEQPLNVFDKF